MENIPKSLNLDINPCFIRYGTRASWQRFLLFIFFMILFTSTAIPFRLVPIPNFGVLFRLVLMAVILVAFPIDPNRRTAYSSLYFVGVSVFFIWTCISLFYSHSYSDGVTKCLRFLINVIIPLVLFYLVYLEDDDFHILTSAVLIGAILSLMVAVMTSSDLSNPLGRGATDLSSGITLARSFGLGVLILFSRTIFSSKRHWVSTLVFLGFGVCLLVGIILTGTRGVMIGLVMTIAVVMFLLLVKGRALKTIFIIVPVLLISGYVLASNPFIQQTAGYKRFRALYRQMDGLVPEDSSRLKMFAFSYKQFRQQPLTGIGSGGSYSFNLINWEGVNVGYSHNLFLEIASEFGVIGLSILGLAMVPCGLVLVRIIINFRKRYMFRVTAASTEPGRFGWAGHPAVDILLGYHEDTGMTVSILFIFLLINAQVSGDIASNFKLWMTGFLLCALPPVHQGLRIAGRKAFVQYFEPKGRSRQPKGHPKF